jgi:hypothetical protein
MLLIFAGSLGQAFECPRRHAEHHTARSALRAVRYGPVVDHLHQRPLLGGDASPATPQIARAFLEDHQRSSLREPPLFPRELAPKLLHALGFRPCP